MRNDGLVMFETMTIARQPPPPVPWSTANPARSILSRPGAPSMSGGSATFRLSLGLRPTGRTGIRPPPWRRKALRAPSSKAETSERYRMEVGVGGVGSGSVRAHSADSRSASLLDVVGRRVRQERLGSRRASIRDQPKAGNSSPSTMRQCWMAPSVAGMFSGRALGARPALVDGNLGLVWMVSGRLKVACAFTLEMASLLTSR